MGKRRVKEKPLRHVRLHHWMMEQSAWKSLSAVARALYVELASRYIGSNNGQIVYSVRQAAAALKVSKDTASRAFEELQKRGFIAVQHKGGFNLKEQKGQAT
jgi:DNA-binding transcriptional MocR family regulator